MNRDLENITTLIGNLVIFSILAYAVFILGFSGWWFGLILIINFQNQKHE